MSGRCGEVSGGRWLKSGLIAALVTMAFGSRLPAGEVSVPSGQLTGSTSSDESNLEVGEGLRLSLRHRDGQILITPFPPGADFLLQQTDHFPVESWTNLPRESGGAVVVPSGNHARFFRLAQSVSRFDAAASLIYLPPGTFVMGSAFEENDRQDDEGPLTRVTFTEGFWMARCEVTQADYSSVMCQNPSRFAGEGLFPVETVNWDQAAEFCRRLTELERIAGRITADYEYRLPTEAQWEYACRAGGLSRFTYGADDGYRQLPDFAWFEGNGGGGPHPVGQKLPNAWGFHDLHGGVAEWCDDWYMRPYPGEAYSDPAGPEGGWFRVSRGGSWADPARSCRSAARGAHAPEFSSSRLGFRMVLVRSGTARTDTRQAVPSIRQQDYLISADPRLGPLHAGVPGADFHLDGRYVSRTAGTVEVSEVPDQSGFERHAVVMAHGAKVKIGGGLGGVLLAGRYLRVPQAEHWIRSGQEWTAFILIRLDALSGNNPLLTLTDGTNVPLQLRVDQDGRFHSIILDVNGDKAGVHTDPVVRPQIDYCLAARFGEGALRIWINGLELGSTPVQASADSGPCVLQWGGAEYDGRTSETSVGLLSQALWYSRGLEEQEMNWVAKWLLGTRGIKPWGGHFEGVVHLVTSAEVIAQDPTQQTYVLPWTLIPAGRMAVGIIYQHGGGRNDNGRLLTVTHGNQVVSRAVNNKLLPSQDPAFVEDGVLLEHAAPTGGAIRLSFPEGQIHGVIVRAPQGAAATVFSQDGALFCHPTVIQHSNGRTYWTEQEMYSGNVYLSDSTGASIQVFPALPSDWNEHLHGTAILGELSSGDIAAVATFHARRQVYLRLVSPELKLLSPIRDVGGTGASTYAHLAITADDRLHLLTRGSASPGNRYSALRLTISHAQSMGWRHPVVERDQITSDRLEWMYPVYWRVHRDADSGDEFVVAGWRQVHYGIYAIGISGAIWHPASNRWFNWAGSPADGNVANGTLSAPRFTPASQRTDVAHGGLCTRRGEIGGQVWHVPHQPGLWVRMESYAPERPTASVMTVLGTWRGLITDLTTPTFTLHSFAPSTGVTDLPIWENYRPSTALGGGSMVPVSESAALLVVTERDAGRVCIDAMGRVPNAFYDAGGTQLGVYLLTYARGKPVCRRLTGSEALPGWVEPHLTMLHVDYAEGSVSPLKFRVQAAVNELHPAHRGSRTLFLSLPGLKSPKAP